MHGKHTELSKRFFCKISHFYSMGNTIQLPPVTMISMANDFDPNTLCSADGIRKISFFEYINPPNEYEIVTFTFHMTNVVKQKDGIFKDTLFSIRNKILTNEQYHFLINRYI